MGEGDMRCEKVLSRRGGIELHGGEADSRGVGRLRAFGGGAKESRARGTHGRVGENAAAR